MSDLQEQVGALTVDIRAVPDQFRRLLVPQAPVRSRRAVASGTVPMSSEGLIAALCYLLTDRDTDVSHAARDTLQGLDDGLLAGFARGTDSAGLLHEIARAVPHRDPVSEAVLTNPSAHDETFHYLARHGRAHSLAIIAHNQVRIARYPAIVEALYFNPEAPMSVVAQVLETCVRQGIDISGIPGHEEIVASILGVRDPADPASRAEAEAEEMASVESEAAEAGGPQGVPDDAYRDLLTAAEDESGAASSRMLTWNQMQEMSIAQKVRLALVGNSSSRAMLIRDTRRVVARAVLRSPKLTEKELAAYAKNKALPDHLIRMIARRRDWVKNLEIKRSLVQNPKCPPQYSLRFLPALDDRTIRELARSKDIPTYVMQAASRLWDQRKRRRDGNFQRGKKR